MSFCLVLLSYIHDSQMSKFKGSVTRNNWDTRLEQHSPWQWRLCGHTSRVAPCWCYSPALLPCISVTQGFGVCMCTVPLVLVAFCRMYRTRAFSLRAQVLPNLQGLMTSSCWWGTSRWSRVISVLQVTRPRWCCSISGRAGVGFFYFPFRWDNMEVLGYSLLSKEGLRNCCILRNRLHKVIESWNSLGQKGP